MSWKLTVRDCGQVGLCLALSATQCDSRTTLDRITAALILAELTSVTVCDHV